MTNESNPVTGVSLVPEQSEDYLNNLQIQDYREYRRQLLNWMISLGKHPERGEGYSESTVKARSRRIDKFYRWLWKRNDGYTLNFEEADANEFVLEIAQSDYSNSYKAGIIKSMKTLFEYRAWKQDTESDWEPPINFSTGLRTHQPRNFFTVEELNRLLEASLEIGSFPSYDSLSPEERDKWKIYLAQRLEKRKEDISLSDWEEANSWKFPSMIYTAVDAGFRPVEIERAKVEWLDLSNQRLMIPKEDSSKNRENWTVSLRSATVRMLNLWLEEREEKEKYDDSSQLWLTKYGNPYTSNSLNKNILPKLCEEAGITRDVSWYAIRHGAGTMMRQAKGLKAAQFQLRHKDPRTTQQYDQAPEGERRDALEGNLGG